MARFLFEAYPRGADADLDPVSGGKMYVYAAGTTTPAAVYSDVALSVAHAHPIIANSAGIWPQVYAHDGSYKIVVKDADDVTLQTVDNIEQAGFDSILGFGRRFENVEEMVEAFGLTIGNVVQTIGYTTPGDGGGNTYLIVAGGTGTDDAGAYIDLDSGLQAKGLFPDGYRPEHWGAKGDGTNDDQPAMQACLDHLSDIGGGVMSLSAKTYKTATTEGFDCVRANSGSAGTLEPTTVYCALTVRAGVSIIGRGPSGTEIVVVNPGTTTCGIGCVEYADAALKGFKLTGVGGSATGAGNVPHGIMLSLIQDSTHVNENITFEDLHIDGWPSYGIGHQYGHAKDCFYRNILIENTGADGIDHKIRFGPNDPNWDGCKNVRFEGITIRGHGQRLTGSSGIDLRGPCSLDQITVFEITTDNFGLTFSAGIAQGDDEVRTPSARTVLNNFFIEAADPDNTVTGIHLFSGGPAVIGDGYIHWCKTGVWVRAQTASPSLWRDSQNLSNIIVEGARGGNSFLIDNPRAHLSNCRSLADVQYFDDKRGYVMEGEDTFAIKGGYSGGSTSVLLNGAAQTIVTHYSITGNNLVFVTPCEDGDEVILAVHTSAAIDMNAQYCSITGGGCDEFHTTGVSLGDSSVVATTAMAGYVNEAGASLLARNLSGVMVLQPSGPATDIDLHLHAKGAGDLILSQLPTSASGLPSNAVWNDSGTLKIV